jgi:hypothetical protein
LKCWHIFAQHDVEVAGSADRQMVEAFAAKCPDEAFRDRVRPRCPDRSADDADVGAGEHGVERVAGVPSRVHSASRAVGQSPELGTLAAYGVEVHGPTPGGGGIVLAFFADPDGNPLYLAEEPH